MTVDYFLYVASLAAIYVILTQSLNLLVGLSGLLSLAHAALFGVGAYATAILVTAGLPPLLALVLAPLSGSLFGLAASKIAIRNAASSFVLATWALQLVIQSLLHNWSSVTGGEAGIVGIVRPDLWWLPIPVRPAFTVFAGVIALLVTWACHRLNRSAYGRTLRAIRDDSVAACALGKDVVAFRRSVFVVASTVAATAGALFAFEMRSVEPGSFTLEESILCLSALILGGTGNVRGPLVGGIVFIAGQELVRFLPEVLSASFRQVAFASGLLILLMLRPRGLLGEYGVR